jgi:SDR family mycofactocin-dependent oxidoreductase
VGRVDGKVAFVTGAARGQGRSHAVRLAQEGADVLIVDVCGDVETSTSPPATRADLDQTARAIRDLGRNVIAREADVRDQAALDAAVDDALDEFGAIDIVIANAGIASVGSIWELTDTQFQEMVDINLTGVWKTIKAAVPSMIERQKGSIIVTSSVAGLVAIPRLGHYTAAKHGATGVTRSFATELAPYGIRANSVHPGNVNTDMINNPNGWLAFTGSPDVGETEFAEIMQGMNAMPLPWVQPADISDAILWLASDESRFVTGTQLVVDAGNVIPFKVPHLAA